MLQNHVSTIQTPPEMHECTFFATLYESGKRIQSTGVRTIQAILKNTRFDEDLA